jgi:predicted MFS family arabinose efflux permease
LAIAFGSLLQPFILMMPVFARDVLHVGAFEYGLLMAALGVGAALGALVVAGLQEKRRGLWLVGASTAFAVTLALFVLSRSFPLSAGLLALVGLSQLAQHTLTSSLLQLNSGEQYRGRVISLYMLLKDGMPRVGSLWVGAAMDYASITGTALISTALAMLYTLCVLGRARMIRSLS